MLPEDLHAVIVGDIAIDGLFGVLRFYGNLRREVAFEIERDDLALVRNRAREVVHVAAGGQERSILLDLLDIGAHDSVADAEQKLGFPRFHGE